MVYGTITPLNMFYPRFSAIIKQIYWHPVSQYTYMDQMFVLNVWLHFNIILWVNTNMSLTGYVYKSNNNYINSNRM